jgi:hypothetical protein
MIPTVAALMNKTGNLDMTVSTSSIRGLEDGKYVSKLNGSVQGQRFSF